ncbi:MAG: sulfatase-like hydrolase/transferase [Synoicihabitans sp.]
MLRLSAAQNRPPNFLQILTDDQGWGDLASYGHVFLDTPHIDRLAEEGIKFTHCYSAAGTCSPSRAAILTGRTPFRTGVYRWVPAGHYSHLRASEITLPELLREHGYQTAHFGKWHLSNFTEERVDGARQFNRFGFGTDPEQPSMAEYGYDYWLATGNVARPNHQNPLNFFLNGEALGRVEGFSAQIVAEHLITWLREHRAKGQPFFITLWFHEPHGPIETDPRFMARYEDEVLDSNYRQYLGNVTQIDEAVGAIVAALQKEGLYDETLIWFTSDNGPEGAHEFGDFNTGEDAGPGRHRYRGSTGGLRARKRHSHEGGIRVPGIISWPAEMERRGLLPGRLVAEPIIGSDVYPTVLELAGVVPPEDRILDGESIAPVLWGEPFERARPLYWRNVSREPSLALRDGDWKVVANYDRTGFELFNLVTDPRETTDQSAHEPERFARMKQALVDYDLEVLREGPDWWRTDPLIENTLPPID